jgi:hypothetical protein
MDAATMVASTGAGSMGNETLRFGPATFAAAKKFQRANGITPVSGYVGPLTRAALNTICTGNGNTSNTNTTTGSGVSSNSIPVSVLVAKQAAAKLGEFVVSGNGMVTQITLQRTGLSNNDTLTNVYLYDGANRITDGVSVLTDGTIRFVSGNGLFAVNGSKTITVKADIAASTSGQTVGVALTGVTMMGGQATPVTGVMGPLFSISSATIVEATLTSTSSVASTVDAGRQNVVFWDGKVNTSKDSYMAGAAFAFTGSAPYGVFSNVKLYVDGVQVGSTAMADSNGRVSFAGSTFIKAGSHTISLRGDITGGAGREYYVRLEDSGLYFEDASIRGVNGPLTTTGFSLRIPVSTSVAINSCSSTNCSIFSPDSSFSGTKVVSGASQQTIGKYTFRAVGETAKLVSGTLYIQSSIASGDIKNVGVYVDGVQVVSGKTVTINTSSSNTITLTNLGGAMVNMGNTSVIEIKADIASSTGVSLASQTLTTGLSMEVQGQDSRNSVTYASVPSNQVSVGTLNTSFVNNSNFTGSKVSGTQSGVKVGSYQISTGNEGIRLTSLDIKFTPTTINMSNVTNFRLMDGSNQVFGQSSVGSGVSVSTVSASVYAEIPANSTKTYDVYVDFTNAGSTGNVAVQGQASYQGLVSLSNNTPTYLGAQTTTVATPGLQSIAKASAALSDRYVIGGSLNNVAAFTLTATGTSFTATKMQVTVSNPAAVSAVTIDGVSALNKGSGVFSADVNKSISTIGTDILVSVTFNTANRDTNSLSGQTTTVALSYVYGNAGSSNITQGTEDAAGVIAGLPGTNVATSNTFTLVGGYPIVTMTGNTNSVPPGTFSNRDLGTVTITPVSGTVVAVTQFGVILPTGVTSARIVDTSGNVVTNATLSGGTAGAQTVTLTSGNLTGSVTYRIQGSGTQAGTNSATLGASLDDVSTLLWKDVSGDSTGAVITGSGLIPNYNN